MVSRFNVDLLVEAYVHRRGSDLDPEGALEELRVWAPGLSDESLGPPRLVLVAEDFGPILTNTTMFLIEQGLDLRLVRIQLYELSDGQLALTSSQLLPVPDAEEFMVRPRSSAPTQRATRADAHRSRVARLVEAEVLERDQELQIVVPAQVKQDRERIADWLGADPLRTNVTWTSDISHPVKWAADDTTWSLGGLVRRVIELATGAPPAANVWGANWFVTDGHRLDQLADSLATRAQFDWGRLHELLGKVPAGRWTTPGDLAAIVGTAPQWLGRHLASCVECPNAWRVLGADGKARPGFAWSDPMNTRTQDEALRGEQVEFQADMADPAKRLTTTDLGDLVAVDD